MKSLFSYSSYYPPIYCFALGFALLEMAGCNNDDSLLLIGEDQTIVADGMSVIVLDAEVEFRGSPLADGKKVLFRATIPGLFGTEESLGHFDNGLRPQGEKELSVKAQGGSARVYLLAPTSTALTELSVEASYTTVNKDVLADERVITVVAPPLIAGGLGDGSPGSTQERFDFRCGTGVLPNIGAFVTNRPQIRLPCVVTLKGIDGTAWPHTPVQFFAEAGDVLDEPATADSPRVISYRVAEIPTTYPRDVAPHEELECALGFCDNRPGPIPNSTTRNPRDGLVTLLAVVRGHEGYLDSNSNGTRDENEPFVDEGEPFLDVNDNGLYEPGIDPPPCCDSNGDGVVNGPNGRWDSDISIGRVFHLLWTGQIEGDYANFNPAAGAIDAKDSVSFEWTLVDAHFNPIAAWDDADELQLRITENSSKVTFNPSTQSSIAIPIPPFQSLKVQNRYPSFTFQGDQASFLGINDEGSEPAPSFSGRTARFGLKDKRSIGGSAICQSYSWNVEGTVEYSAGADYTGARFSQLEFIRNLSGTLAASSGAECSGDEN